MPANLPAEAKAKWSEVAKAKNPQEKLEKLEEFLSLVPKHKGTERLRGQAKRQMALLRKEIIERKQKRIGKGGPKFFLEKEGAAQIVILGPTKVGRSSLLAAITNAKVEVSDYPYTTREPTPGMLQYEDLQFQIIEAPALTESSSEDEFKDIQTLALARNADGLLLMVDLSQDPSKQLSMIINELEKARIIIEKPRAKVEIEKQHLGAGLRITVIGRLADCNLKDVENLLKSYRISDGVVKIYGEATLDDVEDAVFESTIYRPAIVIANKGRCSRGSGKTTRAEEHYRHRDQNSFSFLQDSNWVRIAWKRNLRILRHYQSLFKRTQQKGAFPKTVRLEKRGNSS